MTTSFDVVAHGENYDQLLGKITRKGQDLFGERPFIITDMTIHELRSGPDPYRGEAKVELLLVNE